MEKLSKDFFGNEVLICGCSDKDNLYYKRLNKAFLSNGITVYPMPTTPESELGFKTYKSYTDLPIIPKCAYILSYKSKTSEIIDELSGLGVNKIAFYGNACVDDEILHKCDSLGIETRLGCPMMLFASGFCWIHAKIAGVKR